MKIVLSFLCSTSIWRWSAAVSLSNIGPLILDILRTPSSESSLVYDARMYGYPVEEKLIRTEDGYILKLFRIPSSPNATCKMTSPVYVTHGMTASSDVWLFGGPKRALAYVLSDAGYDVWLGNSRGTVYSRNHEKLFANSSNFWQFSYHEIALYDESAAIDYILAETKQEQLHYIGHSQGTTTFFILTSMRPEYNKKFKTVHLLAPSVFFKDHISAPLNLIVKYSETFATLSTSFGLFELPNLWIFSQLLGPLCKPPNARICFELLYLIGGHSPLQDDENIFPRLFSIWPAGCSVFQAIHYLQSVKNGDFKLFDYGKKDNLKRYGVPVPPDYPLEKVVATPIYLYISGGDLFSQLPDIQRLISRLPKKPICVEIEDKQFGHPDYVIGKYAKEFVYDRIINEMKSADGNKCEGESR